MTQPTNSTTPSEKKHNAIPYDTSLEKGILGALLLEQEALTHTIQQTGGNGMKVAKLLFSVRQKKDLNNIGAYTVNVLNKQLGLNL